MLKPKALKEPGQDVPDDGVFTGAPTIFATCPIQMPEAFEAPADPEWPSDDMDSLMPSKGFVTDFCYHMKGKESPVIFNIFAALFAISVMSARQTSFRWAVGDLFPNLYLLFVAPPAICKKGAALGIANKVIQDLPLMLKPFDPIMAAEKSIEELNSKTTPEYLYDALESRDEHFILPDGSVHTSHLGSRAYVWASEFVTFVNSKKYNSGLVDNLTAFYDCPRYEKTGTRAEGKRTLKNVFMCLAGAMTPSNLQRSMPEEVFAGGFMSRCILIYQDLPTHFWPEPVQFDGVPSVEDLTERLGYLAYTTRGSYDFTPEAREWYHAFYVDHQTALVSKGTDSGEYFSRARFTQLVIRIAMLLRMSQYRSGLDIDVDNLTQARLLLEYIFRKQKPATESIDLPQESRDYARVRRFMARRGKEGIDRRTLLQRMSGKGTLVAQVNAVLSQLRQEGLVTFTLNGRERDSIEPSTNVNEMYKWTGLPYDEEA